MIIILKFETTASNTKTLSQIQHFLSIFKNVLLLQHECDILVTSRLITLGFDKPMDTLPDRKQLLVTDINTLFMTYIPNSDPLFMKEYFLWTLLDNV